MNIKAKREAERVWRGFKREILAEKKTYSEVFQDGFEAGWAAAAGAASVAAYGEGGFHGTWNRALGGMGITLEESEALAGLRPLAPLPSYDPEDEK